MIRLRAAIVVTTLIIILAAAVRAKQGAPHSNKDAGVRVYKLLL
jgi:hypothetical protein